MNDIRFYILEMAEKDIFDVDYYQELKNREAKYKVAKAKKSGGTELSSEEEEDIWDFDRREARELVSLEKERKEMEAYGTHKEIFGIFGAKVSKKLSTVKDFTDAVDAVVQIGSTISSMISTILRWKDDFSRWVEKRKRQKSINNIAYWADALAGSILANDTAKQKRIESDIRANSHVQGTWPLRKILIAEICLAFEHAGIRDHIRPIVKRLVNQSHHSTFQQVLDYIGNDRQLHEIINEQLDVYGRSINKYLMTMQILKKIEKTSKRYKK